MCEACVRIVCCAFRKIPSEMFPPEELFFFNPEKKKHPPAGGFQRISRYVLLTSVIFHAITLTQGN